MSQRGYLTHIPLPLDEAAIEFDQATWDRCFDLGINKSAATVARMKKMAEGMLIVAAALITEREGRYDRLVFFYVLW